MGEFMIKALAPVAVFAYNRKDKLEQCLMCLESNQMAADTEVFIFSDGARENVSENQVEEVREYIKKYTSKSKFKKVNICAREKNMGLANSIIAGVSEVINRYGKVIVVEDDLLTTPDFLQYMNAGLDFYEEHKEYGSISAYTYPLNVLNEYDNDIYVTRKGECWGWGTWVDRWKYVDWNVKTYDEYICSRKKRRAFDMLEKGLDIMLINQMKGNIDSWAVRWCYHLFFNDLLTVYPTISRTYNIGFDGSGTHCGISNQYDGDFRNDYRECFFQLLPANVLLEHASACFNKQSFLVRLHNRIRIELLLK